MHPQQYIPKLSHTSTTTNPAVQCFPPSLSFRPPLPFQESFLFILLVIFPPSTLIFQPLLEIPYLLFSPGWRKMLWILTIRNFACLHIYTFFFFIAPCDYASNFGGGDALQKTKGFPGRAVAKNLPANAGARGDVGSIPGSGRSLGGRKWQPTAVFLPGKFHGQRSLVDYSPWDHKESDTTKHTCIHHPQKTKSVVILSILGSILCTG